MYFNKLHKVVSTVHKYILVASCSGIELCFTG